MLSTAISGYANFHPLNVIFVLVTLYLIALWFTPKFEYSESEYSQNFTSETKNLIKTELKWCHLYSDAVLSQKKIYKRLAEKK